MKRLPLKKRIEFTKARRGRQRSVPRANFLSPFPSRGQRHMKVAMYYNNRDVRLEQLPVPKPGPGELLVRVRASGICGSDLMEWYRIKKAPLVLGHEITGEVAEIGEGVTAFRPGDRVFAAHHMP